MVLCSTSPLQTAVLDLTQRDLRGVPQSGTAMEVAGPSNLLSGASQPDADNDRGATQPAVPTGMLSHHDCRGAKPKAPPQVAWQSADYVEQPGVPADREAMDWIFKKLDSVTRDHCICCGRHARLFFARDEAHLNYCAGCWTRHYRAWEGDRNSRRPLDAIELWVDRNTRMVGVCKCKQCGVTGEACFAVHHRPSADRYCMTCWKRWYRSWQASPRAGDEAPAGGGARNQPGQSSQSQCNDPAARAQETSGSGAQGTGSQSQQQALRNEQHYEFRRAPWPSTALPWSQSTLAADGSGRTVYAILRKNQRDGLFQSTPWRPAAAVVRQSAAAAASAAVAAAATATAAIAAGGPPVDWRVTEAMRLRRLLPVGTGQCACGFAGPAYATDTYSRDICHSRGCWRPLLAYGQRPGTPGGRDPPPPREEQQPRGGRNGEEADGDEGEEEASSEGMSWDDDFLQELTSALYRVARQVRPDSSDGEQSEESGNPGAGGADVPKERLWVGNYDGDSSQDQDQKERCRPMQRFRTRRKAREKPAR